MSLLNVTTSDRKYTVIQNELGGMCFERHGEPWEVANREFAHVGLILTLAYDLDETRKMLKLCYDDLYQAEGVWTETLTTVGKFLDE